MLALSSILVRVSNQESDTRYAAVKKSVTADDVYIYFLSAVSKLDKALKSRQYPTVTARVLQADILSVSPTDIREPVGIVVTSPPYPNAYEYWLYHKYRMWWLGFDPIEVKKLEIGARAHFFKRNHHTEHDFRRQMSSTFALIDQVLVPSGYVCMVVGRSKIHGRIIDNAEIVADCAESLRMRSIFRSERSIAEHRKSFNLSHANIKTESVLVFQKKG